MKSAHRGNLLINALFKARRPSYIGKVDSGEWCGCFTYNEVLELIKHGATESSMPYTTVPWIKKQVAEGRNNTIWFYFFPNGIKMLTEEEKKGMK